MPIELEQGNDANGTFIAIAAIACAAADMRTAEPRGQSLMPSPLRERLNP
jgi:hypothetical protein